MAKMKKKSINQRLTKKLKPKAKGKASKARIRKLPQTEPKRPSLNEVLTKLSQVEEELASEIEINENYRKRVAQSQRLAKMGDWERDLATNILVWSDQIHEMTGLSDANPGETYKNFLALIHPDDREAVAGLGARTLREKKPCSQEYRIVPKDGVTLYIQTTSDIIFDKSGNPIKLIGTVHNITEKKLLETAERETKILIEAVLESIPLIVFLKDPKTSKYLLFNREGKEVFGVDSQDLIGFDYSMPFSKEQLNQIIMDDQALLASPFERRDFPDEWVKTAKRGMRLFRYQKVCIKGEDNTPKYMLGVAEDVTEKRAAEAQLENLLAKEKEAREQAEAASRVKDEFLAVLSHELRTPLTTILGWTQMLSSRNLNEERSKRGIAVLEKSALTLGQLIDDLLDVSSLNAGKLRLDIQELETEKILDYAIESCRGLIESKAVEIEFSIDPEARTLFADQIRIQQILWNLLTNAVKFSPTSGKILIDVNIGFVLGEAFTQIRVTDFGKGIRPEFLPHVFESFTQFDTKSTRLYGGLGLGLSIAKKLVESHCGSIRAESKGENFGSSFIVSFPVLKAKALSSIDSKVQGSNLKTLSLDKLKIMLVEDDSSSREVITVMLQSYGAEVKSVDSAAAAISEIEKFFPNILISDIAMPHEDGNSFIKRVRNLNSAIAQVPALALTAYADPKDIQTSLSAGFHSHLSKPVKRENLAIAILDLKKRFLSTP